MNRLPNAFASLRQLMTGLGLAAVSAAVAAGPAWHESNDLQSQLDSNYSYSNNPGALTATVSYSNQVASNAGSSTEHLGLYLAWAWSYDGSGAATALPWSNAENAFSGGGVTLTVTGNGGQKLLLGSVLGDSWIGQGWSPGVGTPEIATAADWEVPLFDFGDIAAGASVLYDIQLNFSFASQSAFDDWNANGSYYIGGQGVQLVPEPASLALAGLALLAMARTRRRA